MEENTADPETFPDHLNMSAIHSVSNTLIISWLSFDIAISLTT